MSILSFNDKSFGKMNVQLFVMTLKLRNEGFNSVSSVSPPVGETGLYPRLSVHSTSGSEVASVSGCIPVHKQQKTPQDHTTELYVCKCALMVFSDTKICKTGQQGQE